MSEGSRAQAVGEKAYICPAESLRRQLRPLQLVAEIWNQTPDKFLRIPFPPKRCLLQERAAAVAPLLLALHSNCNTAAK